MSQFIIAFAARSRVSRDDLGAAVDPAGLSADAGADPGYQHARNPGAIDVQGPPSSPHALRTDAVIARCRDTAKRASKTPVGQTRSFKARLAGSRTVTLPTSQLPERLRAGNDDPLSPDRRCRTRFHGRRLCG